MTATLTPPALPPAPSGPPAELAARPGPAGPPAGRGRVDRVVFGPADQARWVRPSVLGLLAATAVLYLVGLSASGFANEFYGAAVQAGTKSLESWLFGSLDAGNSITVDKPPASLWIMVLSARVLGFSSFAMLLPQALMGVATVGVTYAAVRRWAGAGAGLVAGTLLALTPVAALMFRFNNPDALLVLLTTVAAYGVVRAVDASRVVDGDSRRALRWLLLAGLAIGFAFLTKMLQGLLVLPAFALVYLVAANLDLKRRILHLFAALAAVVVGSGWFIALVALWPAGSRPYIGGSTDNSLWELAIGYNGLGRIFGNSGGGAGGAGGGNAGFGGSTGIARLFNTAFGTEISWFLPAALVGLAAVLILGRRAVRTDRTRAGLLLWGGSLVVTALVFSFMEGTVHPYYAVALAPSIAATVAIAGTFLWRQRDALTSRLVLAGMIAVTSGWSFWMLQSNAAAWLPWLRYAVLVGGLAGAVLLVVSTAALRRLAVVALVVGAVSAGGGSAAYTIATASQAHTGSIPTSGPAGYASSAFGGGGRTGTRPTGNFGGGQAPTGSTAATGTSTASLDTLLAATTGTWSAATVGAQTAAGYELSSGTSVMAIGGWDGSDPSITLAQFKADVAAGKIGYYIVGGGGGAGGSGGGQGGTSTVGSQITTWVTAIYTATTVGGVTVYALGAS